MLTYIKTHPLLYLVNYEFKTGGVFEIPEHLYEKKEVRKIVKYFKQNHPNLTVYFHPANPLYFEFFNNSLAHEIIKKYYPRLKKYSVEEILSHPSKHFKDSFEHHRLYGLLFDFPTLCVEEYINHFPKNKPAKYFVKGFKDELIIQCWSKKSFNQAQKAMNHWQSYIDKISQLH